MSIVALDFSLGSSTFLDHIVEDLLGIVILSVWNASMIERYVVHIKTSYRIISRHMKTRM